MVLGPKNNGRKGALAPHIMHICTRKGPVRRTKRGVSPGKKNRNKYLKIELAQDIETQESTNVPHTAGKMKVIVSPTS